MNLIMAVVLKKIVLVNLFYFKKPCQIHVFKFVLHEGSDKRCAKIN